MAVSSHDGYSNAWENFCLFKSKSTLKHFGSNRNAFYVQPEFIFSYPIDDVLTQEKNAKGKERKKKQL